MSRSQRLLLAAGCLGFLGVAMGAFGAHGLKQRVEDPYLLGIWETGARYMQLHALALLGLAPLAQLRPHETRLGWAGVGFFSGSLIFAGSLWILVLSGLKWLGAVTPFGGLLLLAGWAALGACAWGSAEDAGASAEAPGPEVA